MDILTLEGGTDRLSRNVGKELHYTLHNVPEARRSHLLRDRSLTSRVFYKQCSTLARDAILGAFAKLGKATISFVMSVRLSVRMEQLGSHWTEFHKIRNLRIIRKYVEKTELSLKSDKKNGYLSESLYTFLIISCSFPLRRRYVTDKRCRENQNTHFVFQ